LDKFEKSQILESRLAVANEEKPPDDYAFISKLAAATPAPGGGSAAAYGGAMAAGLVSMVAGLSIGKKKYADVEEQMKTTLAKAEVLMNSLKGLVVEDANSFSKVLDAFKLPKETSDDIRTRTQAIDEATLYAAEIPLKSARYSLEVMELATFVMLNGNLNAISDGASAVNLAYAAVCSAVTNVKINVASLNEKRLGSIILSDAIAVEDQARKLVEAMPVVLQNRAGI